MGIRIGQVSVGWKPASNEVQASRGVGRDVGLFRSSKFSVSRFQPELALKLES